MIELILVIMVVGILSALALPRLQRDIRQEAADNLLSAIRYTQHLALTDNKQRFNDAQWQRTYWQIRFTTSSGFPENNFYTISSDTNKNGNVDKSETALDPANGKYLYNAGGATMTIQADESPNIAIGKKYGVNAVTFSTSCGTQGAQYIGFDHFGRPHTRFLGSNLPDQASYMPADCNITFSFVDPTLTPLIITIQKETGYISISGQPDS